MRILFITTLPPFPPIDGVRIPEANHLIALRKIGKVDCLLLKGASHQYEGKDVEETRLNVDALYEVAMRMIPRFAACLNEIFRRMPFYGRWLPNEALPDEILQRRYDVIWCGTAPAVAILANQNVRRLFNAQIFVAGLSDVHSLVLERNAASADKSKSLLFRFVKNPVNRLRCYCLRRAESKIYSSYQLITVQSNREKEWICAMRDAYVKRLLVLPNGVEQRLFTLGEERRELNLCFVGLVSGLYRERILWFFEKCWPLVLMQFPNASATVFGKGAPDYLKDFFDEKGIRYVPFVKDLEDIYCNQTVMVAPIFKGYGVINKVLEAMASGCLVVGDRTAFNGIDGFEPGRHGLVANSVQEFVNQIGLCFQSNDFLHGIRSEGRKLIKMNFNWSSRYDTIAECLQEILD